MKSLAIHSRVPPIDSSYCLNTNKVLAGIGQRRHNSGMKPIMSKPVKVPDKLSSEVVAVRPAANSDSQFELPALGGQKWTPKFGPVAKLDFSGSAGHERTAEL